MLNYSCNKQVWNGGSSNIILDPDIYNLRIYNIKRLFTGLELTAIEINISRHVLNLDSTYWNF